MTDQWKRENVAIGELKPYHSNARRHPEQQIEKLAAVIESFGVVTPLIVDEENLVLAGNGTLLAAQRAGLSEVPVVRVVGWSEEKKARYCLLDNRLAELSEWDIESLTGEMKKLTDSALLFDTGFSDDEIDSLLSESLSFAPEADMKMSGAKQLKSHIGDEEVPLSVAEFDTFMAVRDRFIDREGSDEKLFDDILKYAPKCE